MADLSRSNNRRTAQDRITNNRDAIAPTSRDTRADSVQVRADMRSAFRADPQGDAIRQFLGQTQRNVEAFYENDLNERRERAETEFAEGQVDAASGADLDPALAQSVAYQRAYYSTTAKARQGAYETETSQELERRINAGATPADIDEFLSERNRAFIEESSDLFGQPDVQRQVATRLINWSTDLDGRANAMLKEKTDRELVDLSVNNAVAGLQRGEGFDLAAEVGRLTQAGLNGDNAKEAFVNGIVAYSQETGDTTVLQSLLDARDPTDPDVIAFRTTIEGSPLPPVLEGAPTPEVAATAASTRQTYTAPLANISNVTSGMGARRAPLAGASTNHGGIDIAVPVGTRLSAPADGVVEVAGPRGRGGISIIIRHADGSRSGFAHLNNVDVEQGDTVTQGQVIAATGNTGNSTGPHLHWTYRDASGKRLDPRTVVGSETQGMAAGPAADAAVTASATVEPARRPRQPGRSLLTPAQQVRILNAIDSIEGDTERKTEQARQESKDELTMDLWSRAQRGEDVSDSIEQAVRSNLLEPGEGMTMTTAFRSLRETTLEGEADEDLVLRYGQRFASSNPNYPIIAAQADRDYRAGLFGNGRAATRAYLDIRTRAASASRGDAGRDPAAQQIVGNARSYVSASLRTLGGAGTGAPVPQHMLRLITQGENEYERRIAAGEDPMAAADAIVTNYTAFFRRPAPTQSAAGGGNTRAPGQTNTSAQPAQLTYIPGQGLVPAR
jgi:murein DD-endopeptidase